MQCKRIHNTHVIDFLPIAALLKKKKTPMISCTVLYYMYILHKISITVLFQSVITLKSKTESNK